MTKYSSKNQLKPGDIIAIPNEAANDGRALKLLDFAGIIKLKADVTAVIIRTADFSSRSVGR